MHERGESRSSGRVLETPTKTPSPRSALVIRLVGAPMILAAVVGLLVLQHRTGVALGTDLLLLLLGAAGGLELARLLRHRDAGVSIGVAALACGALGGVGLLAEAGHLGFSSAEAARMGWRVLTVFASFFALLLWRVKDVRPEALSAIALSIVPVLYVGLPFSFMRELLDGPDGALRCLYVVLVAKGSDIGAWLLGKPFGKHKLIPSVSPGKSWEGLAGGLLLGALAAVFLPGLLGLAEGDWSVATRLGFGLLLGICALFAGFTQSGWKRRVGAKDSSTLIPEMGGVLDMIDSLLLAGPAAWLAYRVAGLL